MKSAIVLQSAGLGDLVLAADLVCSIKAAHPECRITWICQDRFAPVTGLYPAAVDEVIELPFNPYHCDYPDRQLIANLRTVVEAPPSAGVFLAAEYRTTWLDWFLAAAAKPGLAIAALPQKPPGGLLPVVLKRFSLDRVAFSGPFVPPEIEEPARYAALARYLGIAPLRAPVWSIPLSLDVQARTQLYELELSPNGYIVCVPGASAAEKCWPADRYVETLKAWFTETPTPVLLVGDESESALLESIHEVLSAAGVTARSFAGRPGELTMMAALVAHSRAFLGNDTGPSHLAQAYRRPSVVIHGGGVWPNYSPWTEKTIGLVHPLPCFMCQWDCVFGRGMCVESIGVEPVLEALRQVWHAPPARPEVRRLVAKDAPVIAPELVERYRASRALGRERHEQMIESPMTRWIPGLVRRIGKLRKA